MKIALELAKHTPDRESVLTVGVFDGVHRGHRHLLSRLAAEAVGMGHLAVVVTFRNHPAAVLRPDFEPRYLTPIDNRMSLIRDAGVDFIAPIDFDLELSRLRAGQFVAVLQEHLRMRGLVVGPDFAMGHRREGDVEMLASLGRDMGFSVTVVDPLQDDDGQPITSTAVREALLGGDVARVALLMGRYFELAGRVVRGAGRGGPLGFPTANLDVQDELALPGDGIYAAWAYVGPRRYMAATSIGVRPTFQEAERAIEAFILDFEGDLYGKDVRLEFVRRLRDEVSFETVHALQAQVDKDVSETRAVLQAGYV